MKTNQVMIRPMGQFKVEQRTKDGFFNATSLLKQWNEALGADYTIEDYIKAYIPQSVQERVVKIINGNVYLPYMLEPQLRLLVANYDIELYDKLSVESVIWEWEDELSVSSNDGNTLTRSGDYKTYLMIDEASGAIKIGRAYDPNIRERTLAAQIPRIKLLAVCSNDIERMLHEKFKTKRMRGEWFNLTHKDIKSIIKDYGFKAV